VRHHFIAFFGRGVKADGMVGMVRSRKGHFRVEPVDGGAAGKDEVFHLLLPAPLEQVDETDDVAVDIGERVFDGVAHAGLRGKVADDIELFFGKQC